MRYRRGLLVVALCVLWPIAVALINLVLTPGPTCVDDTGCARAGGLLPAALWILLAVAPGSLAFAWWRRGRRARQGAR